MADFKGRLKELREEKQVSREELANAVKLSYWAIAKYETGERTPDSETLQRIADFFGCSVDYLLGRNSPHNPQIPDAIPIDKMVRIPIYGEVRAGMPIYVREEFLGYSYIEEDEINGSDYFYLRVKGDSMEEAGIKAGSLVLVRKQDTLEDGEIGVIIVNGDEATIKRFYRQGDKAILQPENKMYRPQIYPLDEIIIVGRVMEAKIKF